MPVSPRPLRIGLTFLTGVILVLAGLVTVAKAQDDYLPTRWPRFRGPDGSGMATGQNLPRALQPEHREWIVELPGLGHAAPVIWDDYLFVTSATEEGAVRYLYCLDAITGEERWMKYLGMNQSAKHQKSSWASSTPVTDGELVYVAFADKEHYVLTAWDFEGELHWRQVIGTFESQHGQGTSPILWEDLVILANDQDGPSSVMAFNRTTGDVVWSTLRDADVVSYASPLLIPPTSKNQLPQLIISSSAMGITSLNPQTGRLHWQTGSLPARTVGSPVFGEGVLVQTCGGGGRGTYMLAIEPYDEPDSLVPYGLLYEEKRKLPYVPTPIIRDGHIYLCNDGGVALCNDLRTGKNIWTERIGGNYSSSPICVDGMIYLVSEEGEVVVLSASPDFKLWGRLELNDPSHATPAAANSRLYIRTFSRLTSIHQSGASVGSPKQVP